VKGAIRRNIHILNRFAAEINFFELGELLDGNVGHRRGRWVTAKGGIYVTDCKNSVIATAFPAPTFVPLSTLK
jgi:hypothetical protein